MYPLYQGNVCIFLDRYLLDPAPAGCPPGGGGQCHPHRVANWLPSERVHNHLVGEDYFIPTEWPIDHPVRKGRCTPHWGHLVRVCQYTPTEWLLGFLWKSINRPLEHIAHKGASGRKKRDRKVRLLVRLRATQFKALASEFAHVCIMID